MLLAGADVPDRRRRRRGRSGGGPAAALVARGAPARPARGSRGWRSHTPVTPVASCDVSRRPCGRRAPAPPPAARRCRSRRPAAEILLRGLDDLEPGDSSERGRDESGSRCACRGGTSPGARRATGAGGDALAAASRRGARPRPAPAPRTPRRARRRGATELLQVRAAADEFTTTRSTSSRASMSRPRSSCPPRAGRRARRARRSSPAAARRTSKPSAASTRALRRSRLGRPRSGRSR